MKRNKREIIKVKGVRNFRGLGGIKVGDKTIRNGLVFRCASLNKTSQKGIETLQNLNIYTIIDLRNKSEIKGREDVEYEGKETVWFDYTNGDLPGISKEQMENSTPMEFITLAPEMDVLYAFMMNEDHIDHIIASVHFLVDCVLSGKPVAYHCSEGKDRTGILSMIFLSLLGASKEEIMKDYLLTLKAARPRARKYRFLLMLRGSPKAGKKAYRLFTVAPNYLEAAMKAIDDNYGGMDRFIAEKLGYEAETLEKLRAICLE